MCFRANLRTFPLIPPQPTLSLLLFLKCNAYTSFFSKNAKFYRKVWCLSRFLVKKENVSRETFSFCVFQMLILVVLQSESRKTAIKTQDALMCVIGASLIDSNALLCFICCRTCTIYSVVSLVFAPHIVKTQVFCFRCGREAEMQIEKPRSCDGVR